jgi:hypothetical protein
MPQASAFINKVRADAQGRNTKKEYPGAVLTQNYLGALMCTNYTQSGLYRPTWWVETHYDPACGRCSPSQVYYISNAIISFGTRNANIIVNWTVSPPVGVKVDVYSQTGQIETQTVSSGITTITTTSSPINGSSYYAILTPLKLGNPVQTSTITFNAPVVSNVTLPLDPGNFFGTSPSLSLLWNVSPPSIVTADLYQTTLVESQTVQEDTNVANFANVYGGLYYYGTVTSSGGNPQTSSNTLVVPLATLSLDTSLTTTLNFNTLTVYNVLVRYVPQGGGTQLGDDILITYTALGTTVVPTVTPTSGVTYTSSVYLAPDGDIATTALANDINAYIALATISNANISFTGTIGAKTCVLNTSFTTNIPTLVTVRYYRSNTNTYDKSNRIAEHVIDSTQTTTDSYSYPPVGSGGFVVNKYYFADFKPYSGSTVNSSQILYISS